MKFNSVFDGLVQWMGTEESLAAYQAAIPRMTEVLADHDEGDTSPSTQYEVQNGTAVIGVRGPLVNVDISDWVANLFGLTTYPSLQRQFSAAADDETVERVVLDVDSGGGHVAGIYETTEALNYLRSKKPVATYAGQSMYSAAYWLGSHGEQICMSPMGGAGSIGVIAVHVSMKDAMEKEGLKPTVMRSGVKKALGHPAEDFTDEAKAQMQEQMDFIHGNFIHTVAENRGFTDVQVETGMADGRCFYGEKAVQIGLVDNLGSFQSFLSSWKPQATAKFINSGFTAAITGEPTMTLEEALAQVEDLQGKLTASEAAMGEATTQVENLKTEKQSLEAANKALSDSLARASEANSAFEGTLKANIESKSAALGVEAVIPEDLVGLQKLNAQLDEKFQAKFPSGAVAAVSTEPTAHAAVPDWANRIKS